MLFCFRIHFDYAVRFFAYIAANEQFMRKALAAGFDWALAESIEDYVGTERVLRVSDVDMSRLKEPHLRRFAVGGYLNVLKYWLEGGMVETPQQMGEITANYVRMLLGPMA
ncbi:MAG: TetR-like C-terminal domain-containing protein [Coriobacteriales bacterium]|nr:TetR-like C-terminal domain-containing protein [Coriobacteriales bacterium]